METTELVVAERGRSRQRSVSRRIPIAEELRNQLETAVVEHRTQAAGAAAHKELGSAE